MNAGAPVGKRINYATSAHLPPLSLNKQTNQPTNTVPPPLPENAATVATSHSTCLGCCLPDEPRCIPHWKDTVASKLLSFPQNYETNLHT